MSCPCDIPPVVDFRAIAPGLPRLPRAIGDFNGFRRSMLNGIRAWPALGDWRARDEDDLGMMLLEFWAYVADVVAFYDQVHANEMYLRTAAREISVGRLIGLLGYQPRPATAASALLAVLAEGRDPVALRAGAAFRSTGFDDEKPQVFETEAAASVHARGNRWTVRAPRLPTFLDGTGVHAGNTLDCEPRGLDFEGGDIALIRSPALTSGVHEVDTVEDAAAADGTAIKRITFTDDFRMLRAAQVRRIEVLKPTQSIGLWNEAPLGRCYREIVLERLMPGIRPGDLIILSKGSDRRWFRVHENVTVNRTVKAQELIQQTVGSETISILIPAVKTRTTRLRLDAHMNDSGRRAGAAIWIMPGDAPAISVQFGLRRAATAAARPKMEIWPDDSLDLEPAANGLVTLPPEPGVTQTYVLEDRAGTAYAIKGALDPDAGQFTFEEAANWSAPLVPPVTIYGNVVRLRRGETVLDEVLGDGDRSVLGQVFTLKKSPLTYVPDTSGVTERGYRSTVTLWVDGIRWTEIEDFVTAGPTDAVYVLRQNEDGETEVVFGDGIQGRRLPTGRGNVIASYRFGAGFASPPARKITQLAKPIAGVTSVVNPTPASPGSDAESAEDVRDNAPALALLLGRIVSIADVQAVARAYPGVITAEARWAWHSERQTAVIEVDCITSGTDLTELKAKIRNLSEPSLQVDVLEAIASSLRLSLTIEFDAATYRAEDVLPAIRSRLMDPESGLLAPANIGIGRPLFRSAIYGEVLAVPGTVAVTGLLANELPLTDMGLQPDPGHWFDVADGGLVLNGQEEDGDGE